MVECFDAELSRTGARNGTGLSSPSIQNDHVALREDFLALAAGVHPKVVSDRLGHSTISITIDTYSHAIPSLDADAAATVASQLFTHDMEDER